MVEEEVRLAEEVVVAEEEDMVRVYVTYAYYSKLKEVGEQHLLKSEVLELAQEKKLIPVFEEMAYDKVPHASEDFGGFHKWALV